MNHDSGVVVNTRAELLKPPPSSQSEARRGSRPGDRLRHHLDASIQLRPDSALAPSTPLLTLKPTSATSLIVDRAAIALPATSLTLSR